MGCGVDEIKGEQRRVRLHERERESFAQRLLGAKKLPEPKAAAAGCDLFLTGELAERAGELARELQITLVAAGHVATEVFGPQRLAGELAAIFPGLDVAFVDVPSPL